MPKRNLLWVAVIVAVAVVAITLTRSTPPVISESGEGTFAGLVRVHNLASRYYYDNVPPDAPVGAIRGYLQALDRYCIYVPPEKQDSLERLINGQREGVGLHYVIDGPLVRVVGPMDKSPALQAGIQAGDVILAVGEDRLLEPTRELVDERLSGKAGTKVTLRIQRPDGSRATVTLLRQVYNIETVTGLSRDSDGRWQYMVAPESHIAYVRISEFATLTSESLDNVLRPLVRDGVEALVLDLRDNPGGPLLEAVGVADHFIETGLIVMTRGMHSGDERHMAHRDRTYEDLRLAVLVNAATASAPEVVAGALKQHRRAVLVGTRTFGKDVVQMPFDLGEGLGKITLTTARFYFEDPDEADQTPATAPAPKPTGNSPSTRPSDDDTSTAPAASRPAKVAGSTRPQAPRPADPSRPAEPARAGRAPTGGIAPHVLVELDPQAQTELRLLRYRIEVMPPPATTRPAETQRAEADYERLLAVDRQLSKAVDLLRTPQAIEAILKD